MHLRQLSSGSLRRVGERQGPRTALPPTLAGAQVGLWAVVMMCYAHLAPSNVCCCAGDGGREAWPGEILQGRACCASVTGCPPVLAARPPAGTPPQPCLPPPRRTLQSQLCALPHLLCLPTVPPCAIRRLPRRGSFRSFTQLAGDTPCSKDGRRVTTRPGDVMHRRFATLKLIKR